MTPTEPVAQLVTDADHRICVPVPVALLRKVAELVTCKAHGAWCWDHEASAWPCPMARLMQYVPDDEETPS